MTSNLRRLVLDRRGNVAITFALAMLPIVGVVGMGLDYTMAGRREAQFNAIADAAALMTTAPSAMAVSAATAQTNAIAMFNAQAALVGGATVASPAIKVTDTTASNGAVTRVTTVPYSGTSKNAFAALLNMKTIPIGGTSSVSSSTAPNIDFYLLLDTSPSMGIPSTQSGINLLMSKTTAQGNGGCAFACHETNPTSADVAGNPNGEDNYTLARNLGITLRIDLVKQATANLISTAQSTEANNKANYRVATYTFDDAFHTITSLTSNLSQAQSQATNNIAMLQVYQEQYNVANNDNLDEDTDLDQALSYTSQIPTPGKGTNASGDTPQSVLFLVTDGVIDETYPNVGSTDMTIYGSRTITTIGHQYDYCTPLKARGVRIAVLYTPYLPLTNNWFYNDYVAPIQPQIPTTLQNCASSGLYFEVDTGGDISAAMTALFNKAIGTAHLTQ